MIVDMTDGRISREYGLNDVQGLVKGYDRHPLGAGCRIFKQVFENSLVSVCYGDVFGFGRHLAVSDPSITPALSARAKSE
jgi:hypothetical protein